MANTNRVLEPAWGGCPDWCENVARHPWDKTGEDGWTRCHQKQLFQGVWLSYRENAILGNAGDVEISATVPVVEFVETPDYIRDGEPLRAMARGLLEAAAILEPRPGVALTFTRDEEDLIETLTPDELAKVTLHTEGYFKGYADALRAHRRPAPLVS